MSSKPLEILCLPGDGIGPEVMTQAMLLLEHLKKIGQLSTQITVAEIGGASLDRWAEPLTDNVIAQAQKSDFILLGAVGGPKWDEVARHLRPEAGLLRLRESLGLFANLRPAICYNALSVASSLKPELVSGLDIIILRELTGGVYFAKPKEQRISNNGLRSAIDTQYYDEEEIARIAHLGFSLARKRQGRLCSVEKANVMETGLLWREVVSEIAHHYPDVELSHLYADNCAMQLVRAPRQFDVILTDNLFGDLLSDCAAMLTGSLGMLPSASLGTPGQNGKQNAVYEPVHGSAPDIAGEDKANPIAMIGSVAMALRYSLGNIALAEKIESAIDKVLNDGWRCADIAAPDDKILSTAEMGAAIIEHIAP